MFHIGQKVECVDFSENILGHKPNLIKGKAYTVHGFSSPDGITLVEECAAEVGRNYRGYMAARFRPIVEKKTDISTLIALLNPINHKHLEGV